MSLFSNDDYMETRGSVIRNAIYQSLWVLPQVVVFISLLQKGVFTPPNNEIPRY